MKFERSAGIILHPTSLPGPDGIGDLGPDAYDWIDFLHETGCRLWQVLPLGPTGYGDSPYQCFSAFAGNPNLISAALLLAEGLLAESDLSDRPELPSAAVDYGPVIEWKRTVLNRAFGNFSAAPSPSLAKEMRAFAKKQAAWLEDAALFLAIKENLEGQPWNAWPKGLRDRQPEALAAFRKEHQNELQRQVFRQFLFFRQWSALKKYANGKGIQVIGDIPIFVAYDSADAWAHRELFFLDADGSPTVVAGVPPDYFSPTGQLWGNPLYNWEAHRSGNYSWWVERIRSTLQLFDILRLDHFRGFAGYWEVPAGMSTAEKGRWVKGPGLEFFQAIQNALGDLPIIAEDLGEITPDVIELRDMLGLPGMKILQFAFSDPLNKFLPHAYPENCIAYTGTHDNDTSIGWYRSTPEKEADFCRRYLARSGEDIAGDMMRAVWSSVAVYALCPLQDLLRLGTEARMNFPGRLGGNWSWRFDAAQLTAEVASQLTEMNFLYARSGEEET